MDELQEARTKLRESEEQVRQLQESQRTLTERAEKAEKERDEALTESGRRGDLLLVIEAQRTVAEALEDKEMPDATKDRLTESLSKNPPRLESGELDKTKLEGQIEEAIKSEAEYLAKVGLTGKVRGVGDTVVDESADEGKSDEKLTDGFARLGLSESQVKIAANGRN
jgi:hypothetical protein